MNERFEEEILEAAFGDASPDRVAEVERRAQEYPKAAMAFTTYREISDGLRNLREVPEHQLSTDRLRSAILASGLKPKRNGWGLTWMVMPATAAAIAVLGYMAMNRSEFYGIRQARPPIAQTKGTIVQSPHDYVAMEWKPNNDSLGDPEFSRDSVPTDEPGPAVRTTAASAARGVTRPKSTNSGVRASEVPYGPPTPAGGDAALASAPSASMDFGPPAPAVSGGGSGIVVIETERDSTTGANRATEVDSPKNVVIGG